MDLISTNFADWPNQAIHCLTKFNKFNELLDMVDRGQNY